MSSISPDAFYGAAQILSVLTTNCSIYSYLLSLCVCIARNWPPEDSKCFISCRKGDNRPDIVPLCEARTKCPQIVIQFFEENLQWEEEENREEYEEREGE